MMFDTHKIKSVLTAGRSKRGAFAPSGHRCSNVMELLGNRPGAIGDQLFNIDKSLAGSVKASTKASAARRLSILVSYWTTLSVNCVCQTCTFLTCIGQFPADVPALQEAEGVVEP